MTDNKACPYCAEEIQRTAVECPHCQSGLMFFQPRAWHRSHEQARVLGVCAALARAFSLPLVVVRVAFIGLTVVQLLGPILYGLFWLVIPKAPATDSVFQRLLRHALAFSERIVAGSNPPRPEASAEQTIVAPQLPRHREDLPVT